MEADTTIATALSMHKHVSRAFSIRACCYGDWT